MLTVISWIKPLSYEAKINSYLQKNSTKPSNGLSKQIRGFKLLFCLEGLKVFLFTNSLLICLIWQKICTYKCLNEGEVWCLQWKTASFLIYMSVVLADIWLSPTLARHRQPSCLTFADVTNKWLFLAKSSSWKTSVTMMMFFLCHL